MSIFAPLLRDIEVITREVRAIPGRQIQSGSLNGRILALAQSYFSVRADFAEEAASTGADVHFNSLHELSRKKASKATALAVLRSARAAIVGLEGLKLVSVGKPGVADKIDGRIISTLDKVCPAAALPCKQALADIGGHERHSWRGPATDLREALRETLDALAPDKDVQDQPGFKLEANAVRPTMKQKAKYILKNRGLKGGQLSNPETVITNIEEMIGGVVRSVYTRSSVSTHTTTSREEVVRVYSWVRLVLCELLEIPLN
jgi:hypothetical protein